MKQTGFKISFNPKKAYDRFVLLLKIMGIILMGQSPFTISITISNIDRVYNDSYFLYNFLCFANIVCIVSLSSFVIFSFYLGVSWIKKHGDKDITLDLTDIKLHKHSHYKQVSE